MITKVLLADDHALVRHGVRRIIESHGEFSVVAEASSGLEAVEGARIHRPGIAVLDVGMSDLGGLGALERIVQVSPATRVMMVTMHSDERYVRRAVQMGARGYVLKDSVEDDLITALLELRGGRSYFSPSVRDYAVAPDISDSGAFVEDVHASLTARERQIYHLLAEGQSNKEIASLFGLSPHTVETHRARIMEKLGLHTAAELVISAVRRGLVA